ncbi:phosphoenolpyruvate carboxykinase [Novosphingobium sp.]|uniref:phosphoenolpyruvate carboxykinase n=1 Tax=Novosphingobium sp. TaxID=1874826 RepID=UPI00286B7F20|nr:phosphoenolpyruvate carboxykinase [Novosphingobium sp.]
MQGLHPLRAATENTLTTLSFPLASQGIATSANVHANLGTAPLVEHAVRKDEGRLTKDGALLVDTGRFTGRSVKDKYVVRDATTENAINWGPINQPMAAQHWANLKADFMAALEDQSELYVADLFGGSQPEYRVNVRVITQMAWHSLFVRTLLVRPTAEELGSFAPEYTIVNLPSFKSDPERHGCRSDTVIAVNFTEKLILIGNTEYSGEMKKGVFGLLNFLLPPQGVMPMHCSANVGADGKSAIFFGLSGTGKTTLSADASRTLIGDDEHGWSDTAVFNFEGGCYAKMINLSAEGEPEIYATTKMFGTILENVAMDEATRALDFTDASKTENTRGAYPIEFIPNTSAENLGPPPSNIILLTADAFGVLPPIARLTPDQAMYHFLSGYTAKVAGTEIGVTEPEATFSTCFGAAFMPRHPSVYGNLLKTRIAEGGAQCWLVNTGWSGGKATEPGIKRMPIKATRALLNAALDGSLNNAEFVRDPNFGFEVPVAVPGVDAVLLNPRGAWADGQAYDQNAKELVAKFVENFAQFAEYVDQGVLDSAPKAA